jgi:hypothetical protein
MKKEMVIYTEKCDECLFGGACELEEVKKLEGFIDFYNNEIKDTINQYKAEEKYKEAKQYNEIVAILNRYLSLSYYCLRSTLEELKQYDEDMRKLNDDEIDKKIEECDNTIKELIFLGDNEAYKAFLKQMRR